MKNTNKLITALAAGVAIGGILGVLFAPDKGEHTRKKIADGGKKLSDSLLDKINEGKHQLSGLKQNLRDKTASIKSEVEELVS